MNHEIPKSTSTDIVDGGMNHSGTKDDNFMHAHNE